MFFADFPFILAWWLVFLLIGIVFLPIAMIVFSSFFDRGYIFAKILGVLFISYTLFVLGTFKLLPFTYTAILFTLILWGITSVFLSWRFKKEQLEALSNSWKLFLLEEIIFLVALSFWSYIRAHEPSIHGLEKYMDFGFVNSILRADYFPAKDLWLTPLSINYYYFGHLVTAVITKLSGIDPIIAYNLMIATLFAFTFTGTFSIGANLVGIWLSGYGNDARTLPAGRQVVRRDTSDVKNKRSTLPLNETGFVTEHRWTKIIVGGLLAGFLVTFAGNLHTIYAPFAPYDGDNPLPFWRLGLDWDWGNYWYPNATRFIPFTIHEFPIYSFVVSDLHGHVLSIPIVLTIIALLLSLISKSQYLISKQIQNSIVKNSKRFSNFGFGLLRLFRVSNLGFGDLLLLSFLLAAAYMTNAWDGLIYFILVALVIISLNLILLRKSQSRNTTNTTNVKYYKYSNIGGLVVLLGIGSILFSLPFSLHFKPFVSGIGVICAPEFLTNIGKLGPFLFEADHCQRSPLWQLIILHGFWYFWALLFLAFLFRIGNWKLEIGNWRSSDLFVLVLIGLSTLLILIPEFIYAKDIYPGHYRANTMFKLGYEAFMMLGIATAYIILRVIFDVKNRIFKVFILFGLLGFILVAIYPYFAINSYYENFKSYRGLNGLAYLRDSYPTDYEAILWIRENIKGQPVILEAAGESYTDYARVSANTGLPTVIGWPVHEWLWRGSYDEAGKRVSEVERMYTAQDIEEAKQLLAKYNVEYVFVGTLERQKYPAMDESRFRILGTPIYQNGKTVIYKLTPG